MTALALHLPYTDRPLPDATWGLIGRAQPGGFVLTSFQDPDDLASLLVRYPDAIYVVRPRTGPSGLGSWPDDLLDARSWPSERSLRECLAQLLAAGVTPYLQLGNEPELELARSNDPDPQSQARLWYVGWYFDQRDAVRAAFGERVRVAPAPLAQGDPGRQQDWREALGPCYVLADWIACHSYTNGYPVEDQNWGGEWRIYAQIAGDRPLLICEANDKGAYFAQHPGERAQAYADHLVSVATTGRVDAYALFILPGSPQDDQNPAWWRLTPEILDACRDALADVPEPVPVEPPAPNPDPTPEPPPPEVSMTQDEIVALLVQTAAAQSIPPTLLVGCAAAESGLDPNARRPIDPADDARYWPDVSFGLCQQTVRWAAEYGGGSAYPGPEEVARVGALYLDPRHAAEVAASQLRGSYDGTEVDPLFKALCRYNWPAGRGQPASPAVADNYRTGLARADALLGSTPAPSTTPLDPPASFDPTTPAVRQPDDWSCSLRSLQWMLHSLGRGLAPGNAAWLESQLVPGLISHEQGLLDASGAQLAAWLTREYYPAAALAAVTFDDVATLAGHQPLMIGGRRWNHWVGCRGVEDGTGRLLLANPSPGWMGVGDTLTRDQFDQLGPFSLVTIPLAQPAPAPSPPAPVPSDTAAILQAQIARLETLVGVTMNDDGAILPPLVRVMKGKAADGHRLTKGEMQAEVAGVVGFLRSNRP